jgi:hypothetical protein
MQGIEVRDAINPEHHGFAVEHEPALADLASRLDDPRIAVGPDVSAFVINLTRSPSRSSRIR